MLSCEWPSRERDTLRGHSETSPHSNLTRTAGQFSPQPQNPVRVSLIFPPRMSPSTEFLSSQCSCVFSNDYKITRHFRSVFTSCYLFCLIKLLNEIIRDITLGVVFFQLDIITSAIQWHSAIVLEVITLLQRHLFENNVKKKRSWVSWLLLLSVTFNHNINKYNNKFDLGYANSFTTGLDSLVIGKLTFKSVAAGKECFNRYHTSPQKFALVQQNISTVMSSSEWTLLQTKSSTHVSFTQRLHSQPCGVSVQQQQQHHHHCCPSLSQ